MPVNSHSKSRSTRPKRKMGAKRSKSIWPTAQHTLKFIFPAVNTGIGITPSNILDCVLDPHTATTATQLYDAFKIREVRLTCTAFPGAVTNVLASNQASITWFGSAGTSIGDDSYAECTAIGTQIGRCRSRPTKGSFPAMWLANSTNALFILTHGFTVAGASTASGILEIEIDVDYRIDSLSAPTSSAAATVGTTAGIYVFRGLDGLAKAATLIPSVLQPAN